MKIRRLTAMLIALCLVHALPLTLAESALDLNEMMMEIDKEAKALTVGQAAFRISQDKQSIYIDRPEITGSADYTIAYNIYDSDSNPVNYFYSTEEHVAATPGYGGLFNVFIVVTDRATGEQNTQNIGWQELLWPRADRLTVGKAAYTISPDGESVFVDRPEIASRSGSVTIAYNIYDGQGNPVNYFYSTQKRVAATPGYAGHFTVFVVVTDTVTGEQDTQNIGWHDLGGEENPEEPEPTLIAEGRCGENAVWTLDSAGTLVVSGSGEMFDFDQEWPEWERWKNRIRQVNITGSVTGVSSYAFQDCENLTRLILHPALESIGDWAFNNTGLTSAAIPQSVKKIGDGAFADCQALTDIGVAEGNPSYASVDGVLFNLSRTELLSYPAGKEGAYTLPSGVEAIAYSAFWGCGKLTDINLANGSLTDIEEYAFKSAASLTRVTLPETVDYAGKCAFAYCTALEAVYVLNPAAGFGQFVFDRCPNLTLWGRAGSTAERYAYQNSIPFAVIE